VGRGRPGRAILSKNKGRRGCQHGDRTSPLHPAHSHHKSPAEASPLISIFITRVQMASIHKRKGKGDRQPLLLGSQRGSLRQSPSGQTRKSWGEQKRTARGRVSSEGKDQTIYRKTKIFDELTWVRVPRCLSINSLGNPWRANIQFDSKAHKILSTD